VVSFCFEWAKQQPVVVAVVVEVVDRPTAGLPLFELCLENNT